MLAEEKEEKEGKIMAEKQLSNEEMLKWVKAWQTGVMEVYIETGGTKIKKARFSIPTLVLTCGGDREKKDECYKNSPDLKPKIQNEKVVLVCLKCGKVQELPDFVEITINHYAEDGKLFENKEGE